MTVRCFPVLLPLAPGNKKLRTWLYKKELLRLADIYQNSTDGIFTTSSYDDEGAVADFTNLETVVNVSPIPTSRIHSSHPSALILGDPTSAVQTRSKVNTSSGAHAFVSYKISEALEDESWVDAMQEELLQFKIQKVWVLVDLPYGKKAIGTKWVYRNKKDERGVVVRNKARFYSLSNGCKKCLLYGKIDEEEKVAEILKKFDFANVKTASTPIETQKPLVKDEEASDVDVHLYRSMIGSLMYLTASRPDIMFAVCACSRYLKGKPKLGLWYPRVSSFDLESYSDSDYAGANLDRKSTTGGCQFLGRRLISWQCKKQTIVATSTTEAEYVAAASCCNPVYHSKTKHIAIRHHFIRDAYEKKLIQVLKIHTDDNVDDLLTMALDVSSTNKSRNWRSTEGNAEFTRSFDFLKHSSIHHALTVPIEQQTDLSPRLSTHYYIPELITKTSGGILRHSSSDKSLSGNEGDMTLQSVYDLCLSLCAQVSDQAKEILHLKAQIKKLKKQAKPVIKHHRAWMQSVSLKQRLARKRSSKKQRVHKESVSKQGRKFAKEIENAQDMGKTREIVDEEKEIDENILSTEDVLSTDKEKVSTDRPIVSTDGSKVSTDRQIEGTDEQIESTKEQIESTDGQRKGTEDHTEEGSATQATQTPTSIIFGDDENNSNVLLNMSQASSSIEKGERCRVEKGKN
ncbi:hypothetical protein Tco_1301759 [Tanacetum coccineum]